MTAQKSQFMNVNRPLWNSEPFSGLRRVGRSGEKQRI